MSLRRVKLLSLHFVDHGNRLSTKASSATRTAKSKLTLPLTRTVHNSKPSGGAARTKTANKTKTKQAKKVLPAVTSSVLPTASAKVDCSEIDILQTTTALLLPLTSSEVLPTITVEPVRTATPPASTPCDNSGGGKTSNVLAVITTSSPPPSPPPDYDDSKVLPTSSACPSPAPSPSPPSSYGDSSPSDSDSYNDLPYCDDEDGGPSYGTPAGIPTTTTAVQLTNSAAPTNNFGDLSLGNPDNFDASETRPSSAHKSASETVVYIALLLFTTLFIFNK